MSLQQTIDLVTPLADASGRAGRDRSRATDPLGGRMARPIRFFSKTNEFFELSNFAPFGFEEDGVYWPTVEHYFQAQKFAGAECVEHRERIRTAHSPKQAKALGQSRKLPLRADWESVKEDVMLHALRQKFQREELRQLLVNTGRRPLVEASPYDRYWGCGRDGKGKNRLGALLMRLRDELREAV